MSCINMREDAEKSSNLQHTNPKQRAVYIYDESLASATNNIPHLENRASMVHELITAYNLTKYLDCRPSKPAQIQDILTFHSTAYIEYLSAETEGGDDLKWETQQTTRRNNEANQSQSDTSEEFGLGYDCPLFKNMEEFACTVTGGTLTAVDAIIEGSNVAINWCGGWHHAQRNEASGFCYVNDIVIGIQMLLKHFDRVLYVDLDAHHGDGVENAFSYSNKVMTLSIHNYELGYFPGTGNIDDVGFGRGKYFSVNVPLKNGIDDQQFTTLFEKVFSLVEEKFKAEVYVIQLGADCLSGDPLGNFNLTEKGLGYCAERILKERVPVIFLGGGCELPNSLWGLTTGCTYFTKYGPDFTLDIPPGLRKKENTPASLSGICQCVEENLNRIPTALSKIQSV